MVRGRCKALERSGYVKDVKARGNEVGESWKSGEERKWDQTGQREGICSPAGMCGIPHCPRLPVLALTTPGGVFSLFFTTGHKAPKAGAARRGAESVRQLHRLITTTVECTVDLLHRSASRHASLGLSCGPVRDCGAGLSAKLPEETYFSTTAATWTSPSIRRQHTPPLVPMARLLRAFENLRRPNHRVEWLRTACHLLGRTVVSRQAALSCTLGSLLHAVPMKSWKSWLGTRLIDRDPLLEASSQIVHSANPRQLMSPTQTKYSLTTCASCLWGTMTAGVR